MLLREADAVISSLSVFEDKTLSEYLASCGFELSDMINRFFIDDAECLSELADYLTFDETHFKRKNLWQ